MILREREWSLISYLYYLIKSVSLSLAFSPFRAPARHQAVNHQRCRQNGVQLTCLLNYFSTRVPTSALKDKNQGPHSAKSHGKQEMTSKCHRLCLLEQLKSDITLCWKLANNNAGLVAASQCPYMND